MALQATPRTLEISWKTLPKRHKLPDAPSKYLQQPFLAAALTDALDAAGFVQPEMLLASNFALVATVNQKNVGTRLGITTHWLRWWDEAGNLLLWSSERAEQERQRAEQERQRADAAEQEIARLRAQLQERRES